VFLKSSVQYRPPRAHPTAALRHSAGILGGLAETPGRDKDRDRGEEGLTNADPYEAQVDGIDPLSITEWLRRRTRIEPPLRFEVIAGGRSNLTYVLTDAAGMRWVLRRPPLRSVLAGAHDVAREYRIMAALSGSAVPVPPCVGLEEDPSVNGAPFFVMEFVEGLVPRDPVSVVATLGPDARRAMALNLADVLAELHAVDVSVGALRSLSKHEGYVERQLRRWLAQYETGSGREVALVAEVHHELVRRVPVQRTSTLVHGDFRLDNVIVGDAGQILAVLDWELCTIGDPLADLGLLRVYWSQPSGREIPIVPAACAIEGVPGFDEVLARYVSRSGRDCSELDYFVAFGYWKLALIVEGIYRRLSASAYGSAGESPEAFAHVPLRLLELAAETLEGAH
jgi:aminoglycoside phosphotransferase (APT) family kinase protein